MDPTATIFDLDGTLVCFPINWEKLFEEFKRIMHVDIIRPLVDTVSKTDERTRKEVFAAWDVAELSIFENVSSCSEGMKLYLEANGKTKALVTLQGKKTVKLVLERFGLSFDAIATREDSLSRSDQLILVGKKLGVPVTEVRFVGNADSDEAAAKKVGCQFVRV